MLYFVQISLFWIAHLFLKAVFKLRVTFQADEEYLTKPILIVMNHHSLIDAFLLFSTPFHFVRMLAPVYFITAAKYYDNPLLRPWLKLLGCFKVKSLAWSLDEYFSETITLIRTQKNVLIFPEGRRVSINTQVKAKPGVGYIVKKTNPTILPIHIKGTENLKQKTFWANGRNIGLVIGKSFKIRNARRRGYEDITREVINKVYSL